MQHTKTPRGFDLISFTDANGEGCSLQQSSAADEEKIWLGVDDANPQILASKIDPSDTGWVDYPIPDDVEITTRMHLNKQQARELSLQLWAFSQTGEFKAPTDNGAG